MDEGLNKIIENFENRLQKIEGVLFSENKRPEKSNQEDYSGLSGGLRFLVGQEFFNSPKKSSEVMNELKREGYNYSIGSVDKLLRDFVKNKILTRINENGVWKYARRK